MIRKKNQQTSCPSDFIFSKKKVYFDPENCEEQNEEAGLRHETDESTVWHYSLLCIKSPGPDELHPRLLKKLTEGLANPLSLRDLGEQVKCHMAGKEHVLLQEGGERLHKSHSETNIGEFKADNKIMNL